VSIDGANENLNEICIELRPKTCEEDGFDGTDEGGTTQNIRIDVPRTIGAL
jgi:hypothetical protein